MSDAFELEEYWEAVRVPTIPQYTVWSPTWSEAELRILQAMPGYKVLKPRQVGKSRVRSLVAQLQPITLGRQVSESVMAAMAWKATVIRDLIIGRQEGRGVRPGNGRVRLRPER